jgi:hypothetical protein
MRSISSRLMASLVRSYSLVVRGDSWFAICCTCSDCTAGLQTSADLGSSEGMAARRATGDVGHAGLDLGCPAEAGQSPLLYTRRRTA